ncbi:MAG: LacI family DNA-binding transcriptional regulator [Victivallales bacterium]|jgi:LacI family transcriptional regulator
MVTIKDIAKEAKVSYTAVSVVLGERSSPGRVSEKMRTRIREIAARMGYSRNAVATNMRHGKTRVIAFISSDISQEYTSRVLEGASKVIDRNHFFLKLITVENNENFKISLDRLLEQRPSGLIARGLRVSQLEILSESAKSHDIPTALVDNYQGKPGTVNVFSDDNLGMLSMVEHLHSLGHKRIAHISNGLNLGFAARRYHGFCQGMKKCGLALDDSLLFEGLYETKQKEFHAFVKKIVSGRLSATAICHSTDFQALTTMNIVQSLGKRVPDDISITGYGDMSFCQNSFPSLTTVKQPFEKMGMAAADELIKVIKGEKFEPTVQVPTELVIRDSGGLVRVTTKALREVRKF